MYPFIYFFIQSLYLKFEYFITDPYDILSFSNEEGKRDNISYLINGNITI